MNKLDKKYNLLFIKFEQINNDNEKSHILQDKIYRTEKPDRHRDRRLESKKISWQKKFSCSLWR